jgi:hypothetical protein
VEDMLTEDSRVLAGTVGQPPKLLKHLTTIAGAFETPERDLRFHLRYAVYGKLIWFWGTPNANSGWAQA